MEKIWLKEYMEGVPHEIDMSTHANIVAVLDEAVQKYGDKTAYVCHAGSIEQTLSFNDVDRLSKAFAAYIQNYTGLKPGDKIAIQMPNLLQYPIAIFGALRAGLIVVNTNPLYTGGEMLHQFKDAGIKGLVIMNMFAHKLEPFVKSLGLDTLIITGPGDMVPGWKKSIVNWIAKNFKPGFPGFELPVGHTKWNSVLNAGEKVEFKPVELTHDDTAFLQYTGGTTGVSKGAVLTHGNIVANMLQIRALFNAVMNDGEEIVVTPLPMYHIFALTVNCLSMLDLGAKNILVTNPRDFAGFISIMDGCGATLLTGVNTLFNALMNEPSFKSCDLSKLKLSVGGAMALQRAVVDRWREEVGSPLVEGYGLTEASPVVTVNRLDGNDKVGTIGFPVPSTDVKLVNDEGNEVTDLDKPGEICIQGPQVMQGYYNRPEETANVLKDGWLRTGDIAIWLENGYLKIVDRKKDMILVSGFNVYPNEVEDVMAKHPNVLEVACIGVPDERSNEAVKVIVVPKGPLSQDDLKAYAKEHLTGYKVPKHYEIRTTELPKSNVGKILRRVLKDEEAAKRQATAAAAH